MNVLKDILFLSGRLYVCDQKPFYEMLNNPIP